MVENVDHKATGVEIRINIIVGGVKADDVTLDVKDFF